MAAAGVNDQVILWLFKDADFVRNKINILIVTGNFDLLRCHLEFCCRRGGRSPFNGPYPLNREFSLCTIATNTDRIHPCTAFEYYIIARIHKCSYVNNF